MSLENTLLKSLFPYTAKRQSRPAETIFDFDVNADIPLGHDLPANGGITGNMPYVANDERVNVEQIDTPNIVDDRVSIDEGGATTQPFVPTQQELASDTSGISSLGKMPTMPTEQPEFALPYPNPTSMYEQTQNALAQGQFDAQNPRNRDKGFKGALKEALQNFAFGLSHAQPGMGFWESMALGGTGLGMGIADRSANEKREAMRNLPMLQQNAKIASDEMDAESVRGVRDAQRKNYESLEKDRVADNIARDLAAKTAAERAAAAAQSAAKAKLDKALGINKSQRDNYDSKITTATANSNSASKRLADHQAELARLNPNNKAHKARYNKLLTSIDNERKAIDKADGEVKGYQQRRDAIRDPKTADEVVETQEIGGKVISRAVLENIAKNEFGGDIAKAEAQAKASGYQIQ